MPASRLDAERLTPIPGPAETAALRRPRRPRSTLSDADMAILQAIAVLMPRAYENEVAYVLKQGDGHRRDQAQISERIKHLYQAGWIHFNPLPAWTHNGHPALELTDKAHALLSAHPSDA